MENFTPVASLIGGLLIGLSAAVLFYVNGKIAGISSIVGGLLRPRSGDTAWRWMFVAGLLTGGLVMVLVDPTRFEVAVDRSWGAFLAAGLLVGFGTRLGSGCTSGHGVCGLGRLSVRSLAATLTFMAFGFLTVYVVEHLLGGSL